MPTALARLPARSVDVSCEHRLLGSFLLSLPTEPILIFREYPFSDDWKSEPTGDSLFYMHAVLQNSDWFSGVKCFLMASEAPPLIFFGFCCDCHSDLNTPSSPVNQNNFGPFSARVFLLRFVARATQKTLRSLQTDVTTRERLWLDMPYLVPSGLPLTLSSHVFQEWMRLQEVVAHIPCQATDGGWVLSGSPAQCLVLSPVLNNKTKLTGVGAGSVARSWSICF